MQFAIPISRPYNDGIKPTIRGPYISKFWLTGAPNNRWDRRSYFGVPTRGLTVKLPEMEAVFAVILNPVEMLR